MPRTGDVYFDMIKLAAEGVNICKPCVSVPADHHQYNGFFFAVALRPNAGHGLLILEVFLDHTQRRTTVGRTPLDE